MTNFLANITRADIGWFLFSAAALLLFYIYMGYPLLLSVVAFFFPKKKAAPTTERSLTMIIAARNEALGIRKKLEETLALDYPHERLQIIVVSDESDDGTDEIVKEYADRGVEYLRIEPRGGKTNAQNVAVTYARNEIIVFSDATTVVTGDCLQYLAGNFSDPKVGAVGARFVYADPTEDSPTGKGQMAYWSYDSYIRGLQSRIFSTTGCSGCLYAIRRSLHTKLHPSIIDDLIQPLLIVRQGYRVLYEDRTLVTEETTVSTTQEFRMRVRVITGALWGLLSIYPMLLGKSGLWMALQIWSQKLLRWTVPFLLPILFIGTCLLADNPIMLGILLLQCAFYVAAALAYFVPAMRRMRGFNIPLYYCTINAAVLASFVQLLKKERFTVWEPQRATTENCNESTSPATGVIAQG